MDSRRGSRGTAAASEAVAACADMFVGGRNSELQKAKSKFKLKKLQRVEQVAFSLQ